MASVLRIAALLALASPAHQRTFQEIFLENVGEQGVETAKCVLQLSAKYFVEKKALSGSIVIININSKVSKTEKILLETIHSGTKYSIMVKDSMYHHKNASHFPEKAKNYMMILEDASELLTNIHQLNKLPTWNPHAKAVIFISYNPTHVLDNLVKSLIDQLREFKLLKTIILVHFPDRKEVISYSWRPYSDTNCGGPCDSIFELDVCVNNTLKQKRLSKEMLPRNMNLCPLTVYTVISEPYVMPPDGRVFDSQYSDEYLFKLGIEINLMKIIAYRTNMTLIIRMSNVSEDWGSLDRDGTASGLYAQLRSDQVDIIIGNMEVDSIIRKWFDPSSTYMQDEITWCVPKAKTASTWSNLITIFKWSTWMTTFASLILVSVILHWFTYRERKNYTKWPTVSVLMTFGMILGWGALFNPKSTAFRFLLVSWLLFSININTSYQSFLRSFLIHPKYEKQISTEREIVLARYAIGGRKAFKDLFVGSDATSKYFSDNYEDCLSFRDCVERIRQGEFAMVASKRQVIYQDQLIGKGATMTSCFQGSNIVRKYGVVVLSRKWFPMLIRFNDIIRRVSENGLIWKWNNEVFLHGTSASDLNENPALSMEHMLGAFLFLLIGYFICSLVLIVETLVFKINHVFSKRANGIDTFLK